METPNLLELQTFIKPKSFKTKVFRPFRKISRGRNPGTYSDVRLFVQTEISNSQNIPRRKTRRAPLNYGAALLRITRTKTAAYGHARHIRSHRRTSLYFTLDTRKH